MKKKLSLFLLTSSLMMLTVSCGPTKDATTVLPDVWPEEGTLLTFDQVNELSRSIGVNETSKYYYSFEGIVTEYSENNSQKLFTATSLDNNFNDDWAFVKNVTDFNGINLHNGMKINFTGKIKNFPEREKDQPYLIDVSITKLHDTQDDFFVTISDVTSNEANYSIFPCKDYEILSRKLVKEDGTSKDLTSNEGKLENLKPETSYKIVIEYKYNENNNVNTFESEVFMTKALELPYNVKFNLLWCDEYFDAIYYEFEDFSKDLEGYQYDLYVTLTDLNDVTIESKNTFKGTFENLKEFTEYKLRAELYIDNELFIDYKNNYSTSKKENTAPFIKLEENYPTRTSVAFVVDTIYEPYNVKVDSLKYYKDDTSKKAIDFKGYKEIHSIKDLSSDTTYTIELNYTITINFHERQYTETKTFKTKASFYDYEFKFDYLVSSTDKIIYNINDETHDHTRVKVELKKNGSDKVIASKEMLTGMFENLTPNTLYYLVATITPFESDTQTIYKTIQTASLERIKPTYTKTITDKEAELVFDPLYEGDGQKVTITSVTLSDSVDEFTFEKDETNNLRYFVSNLKPNTSYSVKVNYQIEIKNIYDQVYANKYDFTFDLKTDYEYIEFAYVRGGINELQYKLNSKKEYEILRGKIDVYENEQIIDTVYTSSLEGVIKTNFDTSLTHKLVATLNVSFPDETTKDVIASKEFFALDTNIVNSSVKFDTRVPNEVVIYSYVEGKYQNYWVFFFENMVLVDTETNEEIKDYVNEQSRGAKFGPLHANRTYKFKADYKVDFMDDQPGAGFEYKGVEATFTTPDSDIPHLEFKDVFVNEMKLFYRIGSLDGVESATKKAVIKQTYIFKKDNYGNDVPSATLKGDHNEGMLDNVLYTPNTYARICCEYDIVENGQVLSSHKIYKTYFSETNSHSSMYFPNKNLNNYTGWIRYYGYQLDKKYDYASLKIGIKATGDDEFFAPNLETKAPSVGFEMTCDPYKIYEINLYAKKVGSDTLEKVYTFYHVFDYDGQKTDPEFKYQ